MKYFGHFPDTENNRAMCFLKVYIFYQKMKNCTTGLVYSETIYLFISSFVSSQPEEFMRLRQERCQNLENLAVSSAEHLI